MSDLVSRRSFVGIVAGSVGAAWLAAHSRELLAAAEFASSAKDGQLPPFQVLSVADARDIEAATSQIVPTDETPGAREARVVYFIDKSLATYAKDRVPEFRNIATELRRRALRHGARSFAALSNSNQIKVLEEMESGSERLFDTLYSVTLVGMLSNPSYGGNFGRNGWKWLGFNDQFSWVAPFGWYDDKQL